MAVVIPFEDVVHARRRQEQHACAERCIELIELNLRYALDEFDAAGHADRAVYATRVRHLGALLEYAVRVL